MCIFFYDRVHINRNYFYALQYHHIQGAELAIAKFAAILLPRVLLDQTYALWIYQSLGGFFAQKVKVN